MSKQEVAGRGAPILAHLGIQLPSCLRTGLAHVY